MGQAVSISRTKNDFELVIRATKELEWILETQFGAPNGKTVGLHDKISAARIPGSQQPLPEAVTRKMRKLVTIRNSLVHDREVNAIADRQGFVKDWQEVRQRTVRRPWLARSGPRGPSSRGPHAHLRLPSGPDKRAFVPGTPKRLRRSGALPMPCPKVALRCLRPFAPSNRLLPLSNERQVEAALQDVLPKSGSSCVIS